MFKAEKVKQVFIIFISENPTLQYCRVFARYITSKTIFN